MLLRGLPRCRCAKFTYLAVLTTAATLCLQLVVIYNNNQSLADIVGDQYSTRHQIRDPMKPVIPRGPLLSYGGVEARRPERKRRLTIGIPTIKRSNEDYFQYMLSTMLHKTPRKQLNDIIFVVFLADLGQQKWKTFMESSIKTNYSEYVASGSLEVIQAPEVFYENMLQHTYGSYMYWRTKQNFDYAYLMKYCQHLSTFYMQMEDDVEARDGYYTAIMNFVNTQTDDNWVCLEFSVLGFIGKLYHSSDIDDLADMILMFNYSQPVDVIFLYFNIVSGKRSVLRKPTLFQHLGYHSSLVKKIQPLKDKFFDRPEKTIRGDNPPAAVQTTLTFSDDFPANAAYFNVAGFFWSARAAKTNDTFTILFHTPQNLKEITVNTSVLSFPNDKAYNAVLEVNPNADDADFIELGVFVNGNIHINKELITAKLGLVKAHCMRIRFLKDQIQWVAIKEIAVFVVK